MFKKIWLAPILILTILNPLFSKSATAAPQPNLTISADSPALLGSPVPLALSFNNSSATPTDTGFYPLIELTLPAAFQCDATCQSGISVTSPNGASSHVTAFGGYGVSGATYTNPITGEQITLSNNQTLLIITPPTGTISVGQPPITLSIPATMTAGAQNGVPAAVQGRGIFVLGDAANGIRGACGAGGVDTICQSPQAMASITPTILKLTKLHAASPGSATGPQYPRTFTITTDVANGATVTNLVLADTIPDEIVVTNPPASDCTGSGSFTLTPAPDSCIYTADSNGGGILSATYNSVTGISGDDITISFQGYVQDFVDGSGPAVVSFASGDATSSNNTATANFSYASVSQPQVSSTATIPQRSLDVTKQAVVSTDAAPIGNSPGDTITWTVTAYVSDYFSFDDLQFHDDLQDGQTYVANSFSVRVVEGVSDTTINGTRTNDADFGAHLTVGAKDGSGNTAISLNLSAALADPAVFNADDQIDGSETAGAPTPTRVIISYRTTIDENYVTVPAGTNTLVISGSDIIENKADVDFQLAGLSARESALDVPASVTIAPLASTTKVAVFRNGGAYTPPLLVGPGDTVSYKLTLAIPTGDLENFKIQDYLPTPLFHAADPDADGSDSSFAQIAQGDTAPAAGQWRYTSTSFVPGALPTVIQNASDNSLTFDYGSIVENGASSTARTIEILFTVEATNDPMGDGLQLVNVMFGSHANSLGDITTLQSSSSAALQTEEPHLVVNKSAHAVISGSGSISSGNFTAVDATDVLEYEVSVTNTGSEIAYDVALSDALPSGLQQPGGGFALSIVDGGGGSACNTGSFVDGSSGNNISLSSGVIDPDAICLIRYRAEVRTTALLGSVQTNTATAIYSSLPSGPTFSPESDSATATLRSPTVTKAYQTGTSSDTVTADKNIRSGELVDYLITVAVPSGVANSFAIRERDTATGNPAGDFLANLTPSSITFSGAIENNCINGNPALFNFAGETSVCFTLNPTLAGNQSQSDSQTYAINFGTMTNFDTVDGTTETISLTVRVAANGGIAAGTYTNRAEAQWSNGSGTQTATGTDTFVLVNPNITINKTSATSQPVRIGDTIRYVVTVANIGSSPAYDVTDVVDTLQTGLGNATLVSAIYDGSSVTGAGGFSFSQVGQTINATIRNGSSQPDIANGKSYVLTYDVTVLGTRVNDSTNGPGHPGGTSDGPGCVDSVANSADIASYNTGDSGSGSTVTAVTLSSVTKTLDSDGDGLLNSIEKVSGSCADSDGDGIPNHLDTDSDDNGVTDTVEYNSGADRDGDGAPDYRDLDNDADGKSDWLELGNQSNNTAGDKDGDSIPDWMDLDSDNDGIPDSIEGSNDTDGDGLPDYLDIDADNDGVVDLVEAGGTDANGDGHPDSATDTDGDGWVDLFDPSNGGTPLALPDTDGDSTPNYRDTDSDGDSISDNREAQTTAGFHAPLGIDTDGDGWDNRYDPTNGGTAISLANTDSGGGIDMLDLDSDDDGIPDSVEGLADFDGDGEHNFRDLDSDGDGIGDTVEGVTDTDGDSHSNYLDIDSDNDGIRDSIEGTADTDGDTTPDRLEQDSDNDGISDNLEGQSTAGYRPPLGTDSDNDGLDDRYDGNNGGTYVAPVDTDGDSTPDYRDLDSDGDTIVDQVESTGDADSDGEYNFRDLDSDGDGFTDQVEGTGDEDTDGTPNYLDPAECTITGRITLPSGEGLRDVTVSGAPGIGSDLTDANGDYLIPHVRDGSYTLTATLNDGAVLGQQSITVLHAVCGDHPMIAGWRLKSPIYFVWNGFYRQQNFIVAINNGSAALAGTLYLYDISGNLLHQQGFTLDGHSEEDFAVNLMPGFGTDTYGYAKIEFDHEDQFDGHSVQYRMDRTTVNEEFSILKPFEVVKTGNTYAEFNTIQPSLDPARTGHEIPHWVQIVNLDPSQSKVFTIRLYEQDGTLLDNVSYSIAPGARFDVQAGHQRPGSGHAGLVEIVPFDQSAPYLAQLHQYGSDNSIATNSATFSFATGVTARPGGSYTQYAPISTGADGKNWIIVSNNSDAPAAADLEFVDNSGNSILAQTLYLAAKSQLHVPVFNSLPASQSGVVRLHPLDGARMMVRSMNYFKDSSERVLAAYGATSRGVFTGDLGTAYNSFLLQLNWLKLYNVTGSTAEATITAYSSSGAELGQAIIELAANSGSDMEVRNTLGLPIPLDTYGFLRIEPNPAGSIFGETVRVKPHSSKLQTDLTASIPAR